jgi:hypothetical protein
METMKIELSNGMSGGTSLFCEINATYEKLVNLLGEPNGDNDGYKTDAEWEILINDKVITIYNWKDGKNYLGEYGDDVEDITEWHIGAKENVNEEIEFLKSKLN